MGSRNADLSEWVFGHPGVGSWITGQMVTTGGVEKQIRWIAVPGYDIPPTTYFWFPGTLCNLDPKTY